MIWFACSQVSVFSRWCSLRLWLANRSTVRDSLYCGVRVFIGLVHVTETVLWFSNVIATAGVFESVSGNPSVGLSDRSQFVCMLQLWNSIPIP